LHRGLMIGRFVPGQPISLRKLAGEQGTSAMPVRKALNRLIAEHAVEVLPNRTVVVARMTAARLREVADLRRALEGMAASRAARAVGAALVPELRALNDALLASIEAADWPAALLRNQEFHFALYRAAGSETLLRFIEALWLRAGPFMYLSLTSPDVPWDASRHDEAIAGLLEGDPERVRAAIEADIEGTTAFLLSRVAPDAAAARPRARLTAAV
jgi:DNA-binding GntR family transcriptional regulator